MIGSGNRHVLRRLCESDQMLAVAWQQESTCNLLVDRLADQA
ncbi:MAG: hypothetical protein ACRECY_12985 [Phyllobacterium sp.]